jgi:hypothetical protein
MQKATRCQIHVTVRRSPYTGVARMSDAELRAKIFSTSGKGWGISDTVDNCWMGDLEGPTVYLDADVAAIGGSMLAHRLELPFGRLEVRQYDGSGIQLKDEVSAKRSGKGYLARLERGTVIPLVRPVSVYRGGR